jgi:ParB family chromosome partitioning protein
MGVTRNDLYRFLAFDDLPDFVKRDLQLNPSLLAGSAAQDIVLVLKRTGDAGVQALEQLWPLVVSGQLLQSKVASAITSQVSRGTSTSDSGGRSILKIFAGKAQAGSITKDDKGLTLKFKTGMLTDEQEANIREYIGKMFSLRPE